MFPACTSEWDVLTDSCSMKMNCWDESFISNGIFWLWHGSCCKIAAWGASVGSLRTQLHPDLTDLLVDKISSVLVSFWRKLSEVSRNLRFSLPGNGSRIQVQSENLYYWKIPDSFGSISTSDDQDPERVTWLRGAPGLNSLARKDQFQ